MQDTAGFITCAAIARAFKSSHSRVIRRAVEHRRRDNSLVLVRGAGLGKLVSFPTAAAMAADAGHAHAHALIQPVTMADPGMTWVLQDVDTVRVRATDVCEPPPQRSTGIDWCGTTYSSKTIDAFFRSSCAVSPHAPCVYVCPERGGGGREARWARSRACACA